MDLLPDTFVILPCTVAAHGSMAVVVNCGPGLPSGQLSCPVRHLASLGSGGLWTLGTRGIQSPVWLGFT